MSDATIITGAGNLNLARKLTIIAALALEVNTGLKNSRGSMMLVAKQEFGIAKQTKKGVLKGAVAWMTANVEGYTPSPSVAKAIA